MNLNKIEKGLPFVMYNIVVATIHTKGDPIYNITESEKNMEVLRENIRKQFDIFLGETENMDLLNLFSNSELGNVQKLV